MPHADECLGALQPIELSKPSGSGQSTVGSMSNSFSLSKLEDDKKKKKQKTVLLHHSLVTVRLDFATSFFN